MVIACDTKVQTAAFGELTAVCAIASFLKLVLTVKQAQKTGLSCGSSPLPEGVGRVTTRHMRHPCAHGMEGPLTGEHVGCRLCSVYTACPRFCTGHSWLAEYMPGLRPGTRRDTQEQGNRGFPVSTQPQTRPVRSSPKLLVCTWS